MYKKMKRSIVIVAFFTCLGACVATLIVLQIVALEHQVCLGHTATVVDVATFGDSLTAAHSSGKVLDCTSWEGFGYQQYMYKGLGQRARIHNFGVNSQTSAQIAARVTSALQTDYLTFLMGTNDLPRWTPANNNTVVNAVAYALAQQPLVRRGRVFVATIPPECAGFPRANPGAAEALNEVIWRNANAYEVVDVYSAMVIPGEKRNPAYCLDDLLHFTDAANQLVGYLFASAMAKPPMRTK
jgi:lysophospholipase L1-like esterase